MQKSVFSIDLIQNFHSLLLWANQFDYSYVSNPENDKNYPHHGFEFTVAVSNRAHTLNKENTFESVDKLVKKLDNDYLYGYLSYELQEETHGLINSKKESIEWEKAGFFTPEVIIESEDGALYITSDNNESLIEEIKHFILDNALKENKVIPEINLSTKISKEEYIKTIHSIQKHIEEGDVYELNYCINYEAEVKVFDPLLAYLKLSKKSPTPFNSLLKWGNKYIICASPERFLKLKNNKLISQPIKGTAPRSEDLNKDLKFKQALLSSEKERAENMMIVDLVRNDLSLSSKVGSVKVEELFGIYSFEYVHQMISTVISEKNKETSPVKAIKNAFPMGSMTGAPKSSALKLIQKFEMNKRNVFSGSIGYFKGSNQFDFNVVIRSLFYDASKKILNYEVGGAITYDSVAEQEYEECLIKAQAIREVLSS